MSGALPCFTCEEKQLHQFLSKHQELKSTEIAVDLEMSLLDVELILNDLRDLGKAVEIYDADHGYVWRAVE